MKDEACGEERDWVIGVVDELVNKTKVAWGKVDDVVWFEVVVTVVDGIEVVETSTA
jgi:hypothetical protein